MARLMTNWLLTGRPWSVAGLVINSSRFCRSNRLTFGESSTDGETSVT